MLQDVIRRNEFGAFSTALNSPDRARIIQAPQTSFFGVDAPFAAVGQRHDLCFASADEPIKKQFGNKDGSQLGWLPEEP